MAIRVRNRRRNDQSHVYMHHYKTAVIKASCELVTIASQGARQRYHMCLLRRLRLLLSKKAATDRPSIYTPYFAEPLAR